MRSLTSVSQVEIIRRLLVDNNCQSYALSPQRLCYIPLSESLALFLRGSESARGLNAALMTIVLMVHFLILPGNDRTVLCA